MSHLQLGKRGKYQDGLTIVITGCSVDVMDWGSGERKVIHYLQENAILLKN
jgi:hypothetical protein